MGKGSFTDELQKKATRALLTRAVYRWESAVIIALTLILFVFVKPAFPLWQQWFWLVLGALGEIGLVWTSLTDPEFRARAVGEMFREKFKPRTIHNADLRKRVERALDYRDRIEQVIGKSRDGVLRERLRDASRGVNAWGENIFQLASRVDAYLADEMIRQDRAAVDPAIADLKKRLALEDDDTVRRQISQTIAQKQIQRDNLNKLENVMEQAQFQLESTLTAMGTVYSQMMLLGSRDVASGRADRLQQDINDQVQALQDVVTTVDEVYRAGDPLALGLGQTTAAPGAGQVPGAQPGPAKRKGTAGN